MESRTGLPIIGMVGAGQLARMTHQAAIPLGQSLRILAASPDDGAALVATDVVVGDHTSLPDLRRFAAGCENFFGGSYLAVTLRSAGTGPAEAKLRSTE